MKSLFIILTLSFSASVLAKEEVRNCIVEKVYPKNFNKKKHELAYKDLVDGSIELTFRKKKVIELLIGNLSFQKSDGDKMTFSDYDEAVKTILLTTKSKRDYSYTIDNTKGCGYLRRGHKTNGDILAVTNCVPFLGEGRCIRQPNIGNPRIGITN